MTITPALRRALHQAVDLILDALAAEDHAPKVKRRRGPAVPPAVPMPDLPPERIDELRQQLDRQMKRAGYVKRT